jgi:putative transposase
MSLHSYSVCWLHVVFNTLNKQPVINRDLSVMLSNYLREYSKEKNIYHRVNFVNPEHVHMLIDLPTNISIEQMIQLFKGSSAHWINQNKYVRGKFYWGRGYGVFSVSPSKVDQVSRYIIGQEKHHRKITFHQEYHRLVKIYNMKWITTS